MQSDNNQEMFPIVDAVSYTHLRAHETKALSICTYSTQKVNFTCRSALNGKIYSRANGILP